MAESIQKGYAVGATVYADDMWPSDEVRRARERGECMYIATEDNTGKVVAEEILDIHGRMVHREPK